MTSGYDERYKFIGKERDSESGYDYFGARFLWGNVGIWISVDPLVDKNIATSPYMYCNGNPVMLIDPDGRDDIRINIDDGTTSIVETLENMDYFYLVHQGRLVSGDPFYSSSKGTFTLSTNGRGYNIGSIFQTTNISEAENLFKSLAIETQNYRYEGKTKEIGAIYTKNTAFIMLTSRASGSIPLTNAAEIYMQNNPSVVIDMLVHSHPSNGGPSESDKLLYNRLKGTNHYIFQPSFERYIEYDNQGIIGIPVLNLIK